MSTVVSGQINPHRDCPQANHISTSFNLICSFRPLTTFNRSETEFTGMRRLIKMLTGTRSCFFLVHEHDALLKERHCIAPPFRQTLGPLEVRAIQQRMIVRCRFLTFRLYRPMLLRSILMMFDKFFPDFLHQVVSSELSLHRG
jgi:hypothetical protein